MSIGSQMDLEIFKFPETIKNVNVSRNILYFFQIEEKMPGVKSLARGLKLEFF